MIDTCELIYEFPRENAKEDYLCLLNYMEKEHNLEEKNKSGKQCSVSYAFECCGILKFKMCKHEPRRENGYFVKLVVNPAWMIEKENYDRITLSGENDYPVFATAFDSFIHV